METFKSVSWGGIHRCKVQDHQTLSKGRVLYFLLVGILWSRWRNLLFQWPTFLFVSFQGFLSFYWKDYVLCSLNMFFYNVCSLNMLISSVSIVLFILIWNNFDNKDTDWFSQPSLRLSPLHQIVHEYRKNLARNPEFLDINHLISIISWLLLGPL